MLRTMFKAGLGLLAAVIAVVQVAGCHFGGHSSLPSDTTSATTSLLPPTSTQPTLTYIPPSINPTASSSPTLVLPSLPSTFTPPSETTTEPQPTATETAKPKPTVNRPPEGAETLVVDAPSSGIFNAQGQPIQAESYLEIVEAEVYVAETDSFFRIMLKGDIPSELNSPNLMLEWDFFIDADMNPATGGADSLIANDIGPDYLLRLVMTSDLIGAEIHDLSTGKISAIDYQVMDNTVIFSVPASVLVLNQFNFTVASRKWLTGELVAASKSPNQGHYNMPKGHVNIKPGLPMLRFLTARAIVWYNEGNKERAEWCAEAFEAAYTDIAQILKPPVPYLPMTIFVYASQADLVAGLQKYSGFSLEEALVYQNGGAPRPVRRNSFVHIPPDFDWRDIYYQQVLTAMDNICG